VAIKPLFLVDTSAYARMRYESVRNRVTPLLHAGIVANCAALEAEALYSARSPEEYEKLRTLRAAILIYLDTEEQDWRQALEVQRELAARSQLRGCGIQDLLIAAVALRNNGFPHRVIFKSSSTLRD
jgi:predicted nucleic acid-binding protein